MNRNNPHDKRAHKFQLTIVTVSAFDADRLEKTFRSLLNVSAPIEFLVVLPPDDFESELLYSNYAPRFSFKSNILRDNGKGIYPAMNLGLKMAEGRYISFLNAGDLVLNSNLISDFIRFCEVSSSCWLIFGAHFDWREDSKIDFLTPKRFVKQLPGAYLSHQQIAVSTKEFKRLGGFDERYLVAADFKAFLLFSGKRVDIFNGKLVSVEYPNFSASANRRARLESLLIILKSRKLEITIIGTLQVIRREFRDLLFKLKDSHMPISRA